MRDRGLRTAIRRATSLSASKYQLGSDLTADLTLNPDFSQVEADVAQIDVNTTFALFFPERRPFFQEGSDLFNTLIQTVYTRTINDPLVGAKLTGRFNRTSFAYTGARDAHSPITLPFEERSDFVQAGKSTTNIFRFRQTFLEDSYIGALVTDRRRDGGGSGTTLGADGLVRFLQNYRVEWQVVASHTKEPDDSTLTAGIGQTTFDRGARSVAFDGESYWGHAMYLSFERDARLWNFDFDYWAWSPTFRADNGFVTQNDRRLASMFQGLTFYPAWGLIDQLSPGISLGRVWNFDGVQKDEWIVPQLWAQLKGQTFIFMNYIFSHERFRENEFPGIRRWFLNVNSNFSEPVSLGFNLEHGRFIARNLPTPVLGNGTSFNAFATLKPLQRLIIEPIFAYSQLSRRDTGEELFSGFIFRTRLNYQFTRELFLRLVVQYNDFNRLLEVDPLLTYRLNPFTAFFIGSTHDYRDFEGPSGLTQTSRQFFFKLQYLLRL